MITFRQHLEISKYSKEENGILDYISTLAPEDKVSTTRNVVSTYPIEMKGSISDETNSRFNIYTDIMELVLGQFIMLEQIITGKTKYDSEAENDLAIAELIIRPKHHTKFDNENTEDEEVNKQAILDSPVEDIYRAVTKFLDNREFVLFKQFSGVFYEIPDEEETEEEEGDVTSEQLFSQQWYWYSMVRMLAQEDIRRYSDIYMLKMSTVMPEMSYLAQKNKIESANQRQQAAMRKL
jgi:hypothetical protein